MMTNEARMLGIIGVMTEEKVKEIETMKKIRQRKPILNFKGWTLSRTSLWAPRCKLRILLSRRSWWTKVVQYIYSIGRRRKRWSYHKRRWPYMTRLYSGFLDKRLIVRTISTCTPPSMMETWQRPFHLVFGDRCKHII